MFKTNEIYNLLLAILVMAFAISFAKSLAAFFIALVFSIIIIFSNVLAKKLTAYYLDCDIETRIWHFQRYGLYERNYLKKPVPIGFLLPLLLSLVSLGTIKWFALTQYETIPLKYRVSRRIGLYRYSELTESHIGTIALFGILANLLIAVLAYLFNYPDLARYSIYFAAFNLLPLGNLDGNKIFFGSLVTWVTLAIIVGLFLIYAFFGI